MTKISYGLMITLLTQARMWGLGKDQIAILELELKLLVPVVYAMDFSGSLETGCVNSCCYDSTPTTPFLVTTLNSELNTINRNSQSPLGKIRNWDQGKIGATALGLRKMADSAKQNLSITMFLSGICPLNFLLQRVGPQSKIHSQKLNSDSQSQNNNAKPDSLVSILEYFFAW